MADRPIYLLNLGFLEYGRCLKLMERLAAARRRDAIGDTLLLVEHAPVVTLGAGGGAEDLRVPAELLRRQGIDLHSTGRGGRITYHGPGQLVAYPILKLAPEELHGYLWQLEQAVVDTLADFGISAELVDRHPGVWIGREKIAAVGIAVQDDVTSHGMALNINPNLDHFRLIVPCGLAEYGVTSMARQLEQDQKTFAAPRNAPGAESCLPRPETEGRRPGLRDEMPTGLSASGLAVPGLDEVAAHFVSHFSQVFGRPVEPQTIPGDWLVAPAAQERTAGVAGLVGNLALNTVCQEAACPNLGECWARGTATFMLLGDICTRHCRFCNIAAGRPLPLDPAEPEHVAEAAARLGLRHVVITSVTRDDLPDGGAGQFARTIRAVHERLPGASVEVLVPDFGGSLAALETVAQAAPEVFNHNLETVERLSHRVRSRAEYRRSLAVISWAARRGLLTKSGLMLGLGETCGEVVDAMRDLRHAGCDILTLGQYLQPTDQQLPVYDHVHPEVFAWYAEVGHSLGFRAVAAAPLVRSSYHAAEVLHQEAVCL